MPVGIIIEALSELCGAVGVVGTAAATSTLLAGATFVLYKMGEEALNGAKAIINLILGAVLVNGNIGVSPKSGNAHGGDGLYLIENEINVAMMTAQVINMAQYVIDSAKKLNEEASGSSSTTSQITAIPKSADSNIEIFPQTEQEGSQIYDTPTANQQGADVLIFPRVNLPSETLTFPKEDIPKPIIDPFPAERPKELGDGILWAKGNQWVSKAIAPSKLGDVWKLGATERGDIIEEVLASTEYKDWYNIGSSQGGYFPVIDFQKGNNVVSLKTIDPTLSSMGGSGATNKVIDYLNYLDKDITVNGNLANKILDVRIPEGTKSNFDITRIQEAADELGIKIIIKEFK